MKCKTPSRAACTLTAGLVLLVATTIFAQKITGPKPSDETTAKLVCDMVSRYHIKQSKINNEISSKLLDRFLKLLDPQKLYFLDSDIVKLNKYRNELDDLVKVGDVKFAYTTFDLYMRRMEDQIAYAQQLIDQDHDFSLDETMTIDVEQMEWPRTIAEQKERWRKRIKNDLLVLKLNNADDDKNKDEDPLDKAREQLHKRYRTILKNLRQTEGFEMLEMYLSALTHCFDPHSSYMSPQTLEDFRISMQLSLDGIGAALRSEDGYTTVAQIVPGGAASDDGRLAVGDKIVGVGQAEGEIVDIVEMKLSKVVRLIRGPRGTLVRLNVKKGDSGEIILYDLTRQKIELKSSEVKGEIIKSGDRLDGRSGQIGVINIPSFYRDFRGAQQGLPDFKSTARDVRKVIDQFAESGPIDGIIIDLRTNGGGALSEAIEVSGLFIDEGPIVQVKEKNGKVKSHDDIDPLVAYKGPLVVICNRLSASASEIFAGVIKDYGRGIIVGDKTTHGKGTVQNVMPVNKQMFQLFNPQDRGALKLTINQFYRVNGDSTQNRGVRSDVVLPSLFDHMDLGESYLDNALEFDHIDPADYASLGKNSPNLISQVNQLSKKRVAKDPEFQKLNEDIQKYLSRKNRKEISLNEAVRLKEKQQDEKNQKKKGEEEKPEVENPPIFPEGFYNDEVLGISLDYFELLKAQNTAQK